MLSKKLFYILTCCLVLSLNSIYAGVQTIDDKNAHQLLTQNDYLPGSGLVGTSFTLLDGYTSQSIKGSIIKYTFDNGQTSQDGKYAISDNLMQITFPYCSKLSSLFTTDNISSYKEMITDKLGVSGGFKIFTGSYAKTTQNARDKIQKLKMHVGYAEAVCSQYNVKLKLSNAGLASWYIDEINNLPNEFNDNSKKQYYDFFNNYGDSVITSCAVGGRLEQRSYINNSFMQTSQHNSVEQEIKAKFFISIDKSKKSEYQNSQEFEHNTSTSGLLTFGGIWPESEDNWNSWIESIQELKNPACATWEAIPIWSLLRKNSQLVKISYELEKAHNDYLNRKGCTNVNASNFDPYAVIEDGSCNLKKVSDCKHIVITANKPADDANLIGPWSPIIPARFPPTRVEQNVWMVPGPDQLGNCVITYAYQAGGPGQISQTSDIGFIETSPQRLWVQRSDDFCLGYGRDYDVWVIDNRGEHIRANGANHQWQGYKQVNYQPGYEVRLEVFGNNWGKGCKFASFASISQPYLYE